MRAGETLERRPRAVEPAPEPAAQARRPSLRRSGGQAPVPGIQRAQAALRSLSGVARVRPPEDPASVIKHTPNEYLPPGTPFPPPGMRKAESESRRRVRSGGVAVDYVRDADGRLLRVELPDGGRIAAFAYDAQGRRTGMTDRRGTTSYAYDEQGRLAEIRPPGGGAVRYEYDAAGRLARLTGPGGRPVSFTWDAAGRLLAAGETRYEYDPATGLLARRTLPNGVEAEYGYDAAGRFTDAAYRGAGGEPLLAFRYRLDAGGRPAAVTRESAAGAATTTYVWDEAGRLSLATYPDGRTVSLEHDAAGNRTRRTLTAGGRVEVVDYTYDERGRLAAAGAETFRYDARGNLVRRISPERTVEYAYDAENRLVRWTDGRRVVELEHDGDGRRVARVVDGQRTDYVLDAGGAVLLETGEGTRRSYVYGLERIGYEEEGGGAGFYLYDSPFWNVAALTGAGGQIAESFASDPFGAGAPPAPFLFGGWPRDPVTGLVHLGGREYDPDLGRFVTQAPLARGDLEEPASAGPGDLPRRLAQTLGWTPEAARPPAERASAGAAGKRRQLTTFLSNQLPDFAEPETPRATPRPFPELSQLEGGGRYVRRPAARRLAGFATTGPRLRLHPEYLVFASTAAGLLPASQTLEVESSTGEALSFTVAEDIPWLSVTPGGGTAPAALTVTVDPTGLTSAGSPYTGDLTVTSGADAADVRKVRVRLSLADGFAAPALRSHDALGNLQRVVRPDGGVVDYRYDDAGRLVRTRFPDGQEVSYTYDGNGNRLTMSDSRGTTVYQYDLEGRISAVYPPGLNPVRYSYDKTGNLTRLDYPNGRVALYNYDADGRIAAVEDALGTTTYQYDSVTGSLTGKTLPNGVATAFEYDSAGRLAGVTHTSAGGGLLLSYQYQRDANNLRTSMTRTTASGSGTTTYSYDELLRLSSITHPSGRRIDYTYDELGNRLTMTETAGSSVTTTAYSYGPDNRLIRAGAEVFQYDASGNLIRRASPARTVAYEYDGAGRLIRWNDGARVVELEYDGDGNRVAKIVDGERTNYYNDVNRYPVEPLLEADAGWYVRKSHVYGMDRIGIEPFGAGPLFYLYDSPLRSVAAVTAADGSLARTYVYDAFGAPSASPPDLLQNVLFNGEQYDEETGLIYLRNRYYDPSLGRFLTPDPFPGRPSVPQSQNPYVFSGNDPINFVDQSGQFIDIVIDVASIGYDIYTIAKDPKDLSGYLNLGLDIVGAAVPFVSGFGAGRHALEAAASYKTVSNRLGKVGEEFVRESRGLYDSYHNTRIGGRLPDFVVGRNIVEVKNAKEIDARSVRQIQDYLSAAKAKGGIVEIATRKGTDIPDALKPYLNDNLRVSRAFTDAGNPRWWSYHRPMTLAGLGAAANAVNNHGSQLGDLGGVSLNKTAELMLQIEDVAGATYDESTGQLVLFGKEDLSLPQMDLDDLAVAVDSVFAGQDPGVSIDPPIVNGQMSVRYEGMTTQTEFGWIMFEADRVLKILSLGRDNLTGQPVTSSVPGYKNMLQRRVEAGCNVPTSTRMWFQPKEVRLVRSGDGQSMVFDAVTMELLYESKVGDQVVVDPEAAAFAAHFTQNYDAFAAEWPILKDLKQLGKVVAIMKWIKDNQIPVDLSFIEGYDVEYFSTPVSTPVTSVSGSNPGCTITIEGGVTYRKPNQYLSDDPVDPVTDELREAALTSRPSETDFLWPFNAPAGFTAAAAGDALTAVAQSFTRSRKDGNESFSETDLSYPVAGDFSLHLTRYYDSFLDRPGPFGPGWRVLPYELRFPVAKERFTFGPDNLAFDLYSRIWLAERTAGREDAYLLLGIDGDNLPLYQRSGATHLLRQLADGSYRLSRMDGLRIAFDPQGRVISITDPSGNLMEYVYDGAGRLARIQGPAGRALDLSYDAQERVFRAAGPGGREVQYAYDAGGRLASVASGGRSHAFSYDAEGRLTGAADAEGNPVLASAYDDYGRTVDRRLGSAAGFDLDFDLEARQTTVFDPLGGKSKVRFDGNYRPIEQTDPLGNQSRIEYDGDFGPSRITHPEGAERLLSYDQRGNLTTVIDETGARVEMFYDWRDRLVATRDAEGGEIAYGYDDESNLTTIFHTVQLQQDENGNLVSILYDPGNVTRFFYTEGGLLERVMGPLNHESHYTFDANGQLASSVSPGGLSSAFGYDGRSRLTTVAFGGRQMSLGYDAADNLVSVDTASADIGYEYDANGSLAGVTDSLGHRTAFDYDADGNLISVRDAAGELTSYAYDAVGRLRSAALPNGSANAYEYDELSRPVVVLGGLGPARPDIEVVRDAIGFGEVAVGGSREIVLEVLNVGRSALHVSGATASAPFGAAFPGTGTVPPGQVLEVTVSFSPTDAGESAGTLTLASDDPDEPAVTVALSGEGVRKVVGLRATPTATGIRLDWDPFDPGSQPFAHFNVYRSSDPIPGSVAGLTPIDESLIDPDATSFLDTTANPGIPYYYALTPEYAGGFEHKAVDPAGPVVFFSSATAFGPIGRPVAAAAAAQDEHRPALAYNSAANEYLLVYERDDAGDLDVLARRLAADGTPLGDPVEIAAGTSREGSPQVGYSSVSNEYLVVWEHDAGASYDVYGRRVSAAGQTAGAAFALAANPVGDLRPQLAYNPDDDEYLVVFDYDYNGDGSDHDVHGRRVDGTGAPQGSEFEIGDIVVDGSYVDDRDPHVAYDPSQREYLVAFEIDTFADGSDIDVAGQRVASSGTLAGGPFFLASFLLDGQPVHELQPRLAHDSVHGEYLLAFEMDVFQDGSDHDVWARKLRFDTAGSPVAVGPLVQPIAATGAQETGPQVAYTPATDENVLVWEVNGGSGDVHARKLKITDATQSLGSAFAVASGSSLERRPGLAFNGDLNQLLAAWESEEAGGFDLRVRRLGYSTPLLEVAPAALDFGAAQESLPVTISNLGPGTLEWVGTADRPWLAVAPSSGSTAGSTPVEITVSRTGLAPGAHSGTVRFSSNGGTVDLAVALAVENRPPAAPANPAPADGAENQSGPAGNLDLPLSWQGSDPDGDTLTWDLYLSSNAALVTALDPAARVRQGLTSASAVATGLSHLTVYAWRAVAFDGHGGGTAGPVWTFTTAAVAAPLLAPVVPDPTREPRPVLSWQAVTGAATYHLQVATDAAFTALVLDPAGLNGTSFTPASPLPEGALHWRVRAFDGGGQPGPFSAADSFVVDVTPPAVPVLTPVAPDPTHDPRPGFAWSASAGASTYRLQVAQGAAFEAPLLDQVLAATGFEPASDLPEGDLSWRVAGLDAAGNQSAFSAADGFTLDRTPPPPVTGLAAARSGGSAVLSWSPLAGPPADFARFNVYRSASFFDNVTAMTPIDSSLTSAAATTFTDPAAAAGTAWYYAVTAVDLAGNENRSVTAALLPADAAPDSGTDLYTLTPCRVLDTRNPAGPFGGPVLQANVARSFAVAGVCGIPATARAVSVNVTVVGPTGQGHVVAYPGGVPAPLTSVINFNPGVTRANNAILPLAADGAGTLVFRATVAGAGQVHLVLDVNGYFQ